MDKLNVESQLSLIEAKLAFLREASLAGDPTQLPHAFAELQPMLVDLSHTLRNANSLATRNVLVRERLQKSFALVSSVREGLIRQSRVVDRALSALVPAAQAITYGNASSAVRRQPYGTAARQSGEFKMVTA
jgi:hypothetical protein